MQQLCLFKLFERKTELIANVMGMKWEWIYNKYFAQI